MYVYLSSEESDDDEKQWGVIALPSEVERSIQASGELTLVPVYDGEQLIALIPKENSLE